MRLAGAAVVLFFFGDVAFAGMPELLSRDGFQVQRDEQARVLRVFDRVTDRAFEFKFDRDGRVDSRSVRDASGKLLTKLSVKDGEMTDESDQNGSVERCRVSLYDGRSRWVCS